ncbi:MAG: SpoIID/LytB domain-containing protein [Desulfuromonadales bacterium]
MRTESKKLTHRRILCSYSQVLRSAIILIILVLCASPVVSLPLTGLSDAARVDETIRVAIVTSAPEVTVDGEGLLVSGGSGEAVRCTLPVVVKPFKDGLSVEGKTYRRLSFSSPSAVYVNGKPYRGLAELSRTDKGILVINQLPLEEYLVGLINCEISSAWPIEAVKAQAVIARTYALNRKATRSKSLYHLESSVIDQVYDGCLIEDSRAQRAVSETAGEVLTYGDAVIQAFYHSSCGGRTEASEHVWGAVLPYLKGVECQYCLSSPLATAWEYKSSLGAIEERLRAAGHKISGVTDVRPGGLNPRGRLKQVVIVSPKGEITLAGDQFRKVIGYGAVKSTRFIVKNVGSEVTFTGSGNGHGVGLCQWGAKHRALDGFEYGEILSYYYPGTILKQFSDIQ